MNPKISIIIAYHDERRSPQNIRTWTDNQTLAQEKFEVIVITHAQTRVEPELKKILRSQDRLIVADVPSGPYPLNCVGAAAARGDILFFTEDHCIAEPECLESIERFFQDNSEPAATMLWRCVNRSTMAKAEAQLNQIDRKTIESNSGWNRVRIRSFAIKKYVYDEVGGFDNRYGNFAETLLGAHLHKAGYTIGTITKVGVKHINSYKVSHLFKDVYSYGWHEAKFCVEDATTFTKEYFDADSILLKDRMIPAIAAQSLAAGLVRSLAEEFKSSFPFEFLRKPHTREWLGELSGLSAKSCSLNFQRVAAWLNLQLSNLRFSFLQLDVERRVQAFSDIWQAVMWIGRVSYLAQAGIKPSLHAAASYEASNEQANNAIGFHSIESANGKTFRWTKPAAFLLLDAPCATRLVTVDTGSIVAEQHCRGFSKFFWNDKRIPDDQVTFADGKIQFVVKESICKSGRDQRLTIISNPHHVCAQETRRLGLPICSVTTTAVADSGQTPEVVMAGKKA